VVGDGQFGGDGVGLVADVEHAVLVESAHPLEQHLGVALDQGGAAGDVGVESFPDPVVEGEHVVAGRLEQEQALEFGQLLGLLAGQVMGLGPVGVAVVQLPGVVREWLDLGHPGGPGVRCLVTADQPW
jgi:hypothetical protein